MKNLNLAMFYLTVLGIIVFSIVSYNSPDPNWLTLVLVLGVCCVLFGLMFLLDKEKEENTRLRKLLNNAFKA
jgi:uncharacterized membrane protein HdeD (DUF308 family)